MSNNEILVTFRTLYKHTPIWYKQQAMENSKQVSDLVELQKNIDTSFLLSGVRT